MWKYLIGAGGMGAMVVFFITTTMTQQMNDRVALEMARDKLDMLRTEIRWDGGTPDEHQQERIAQLTADIVVLEARTQEGDTVVRNILKEGRDTLEEAGSESLTLVKPEPVAAEPPASDSQDKIIEKKVQEIVAARLADQKVAHTMPSVASTERKKADQAAEEKLDKFDRIKNEFENDPFFKNSDW